MTDEHKIYNDALENAVKTAIHVDGDTTIIKRWQDDEAIIERNKKELNSSPKLIGSRYRESFTRIASIPQITVERWMIEDQVNILGMSKDEFEAYILRKLNDPDNKYLRTMSGVL